MTTDMPHDCDKNRQKFQPSCTKGLLVNPEYVRAVKRNCSLLTQVYSCNDDMYDRIKLVNI